MQIGAVLSKKGIGLLLISVIVWIGITFLLTDDVGYTLRRINQSKYPMLYVSEGELDDLNFSYVSDNVNVEVTWFTYGLVYESFDVRIKVEAKKNELLFNTKVQIDSLELMPYVDYITRLETCPSFTITSNKDAMDRINEREEHSVSLGYGMEFRNEMTLMIDYGRANENYLTETKTLTDKIRTWASNPQKVRIIYEDESRKIHQEEVLVKININEDRRY